jgi:hypothetical protein
MVGKPGELLRRHDGQFWHEAQVPERWGISGAGGRPAVPSACRLPPLLTRNGILAISYSINSWAPIITRLATR